MGIGDMFNLEKQLGFYAQYHHNTVNFALHVVGVPMLLWSGFVYFAGLYQCPMPEVAKPALETVGLGDMPFHGGLLAAGIYAAGYIAMEPFAGSLASILLGLGGITSYTFYSTSEHPFLYATAIQIACWSMQIYGHYAYEKRAPAFLDNIFQSFYLAPYFVFLEIMFLFGYRPELAKRIYNNAERDIKQWRASQKKAN
ncbi:hypothetical protein PTSG_12698 [Salpingoeca rosetta]|uniref:DUF962 domain-containing protein n=1 Tax=Salpingoeca rosetta (strain ATCC 50818 / BSB-021) TaxID=946362 RepID=F2UIG5_SALR5|nr:uncharacterized protein PTSG_12698 [Salpingoeca rosetta]EGD76914.1 hypothetical protein PTSG_12698 [Salpingoeca rosetta]|eukprot:XP_004991285.1 hypothetical protein PTSG_12698 [Salpingoeca rosetta]